MAILRPSAEISNIGWSLHGGSNYATILSDESDSTYIHAPTATGANATVDLQNGTDPGLDTGFLLKCRAERTGTSGTVDIGLYQGATLKAVDTFTLTGSFAEYSYSLSGAECASITDFTDLNILVDNGAGDLSGTIRVSEVWLELPGTGGGTVNVVGGAVQCTNIQPVISAISGATVTITGVDKADNPISYADAVYGQICSASGLWYPARRIVIINGRPYGDDMAFKEQEPPRGQLF